MSFKGLNCICAIFIDRTLKYKSHDTKTKQQRQTC